ncbi:MAG: [acyl-carrier-protein] S-malonyltransferase [Methylococcaceae bacterium]|nr:MAG: [acyl-carrier-protein] S-malonyltransferase [Methylococcaceae bacterium]
MKKPIVFLYSGQGSHYPGMGRRLFDEHPLFRACLLELDSLAQRRLGASVIARLYAADPRGAAAFDRTPITSPALFMVQYALSQVVLQAGLRPDYLLGSSLGEFVALAVAGAIDPGTALHCVIDQSRHISERCRPGGMIAVVDPINSFRQLKLDRYCELAGINYDRHYLVSGTDQALAQVEGLLRQNGIPYQRLPVDQGFHSSLMDPAEAGFRAMLPNTEINGLRYPVFSCVDGKVISHLSTSHAWRVVRQPIRFDLAIQPLLERQPLFIDLGPSGTLCNFTKRYLPEYRHAEAWAVMTPFGQDNKNLDALFERLQLAPAHATAGRQPPTPTAKGHTMKAYVFPGQGSQKKGMGKDLFDRFPHEVALADATLGFSIRELCENDPDKQLNQTRYTQPALYVVSALSYLQKLAETGAKPDYLAGHSLGEYVALFAGGAFDFETGLRLVKKRGELMGQAQGGGMAAVIAVGAAEIRNILADNRLDRIDIANYNSPSQHVLSGDKTQLDLARPIFEAIAGARFIPLNVSAAFHSRFMAEAKSRFAAFLQTFEFSPLSIPVIANVTARPYRDSEIKQNLADQIDGSVQWTDSIRYLLAQGPITIEELGPGQVLTQLVQKIIEQAGPLADATQMVDDPAPKPAAPPPAATTNSPCISLQTLGSAAFKRSYGVDYPYVAGAMYRGIASTQLVIRMAQAGMLSFFGTGGLSKTEIEAGIQTIQAALRPSQPYGMNLLHNLNEPEMEDETVDVFLKHRIENIEASAYMQTLSAALVRFRVQGLFKNSRGQIEARHRIIAKISRPEVAAAFMAPPPEKLLQKLLSAGQISAEQAQWAANFPVAGDLCVEADSGGHTDRGVLTTILPAILMLRDEIQGQYRYDPPIRVGAAGGIGTPEAAAAAFVLGADFITTGSINQCTVEAGTSAAAKTMLQGMNVQDTDYAPAGDMFELGAKVQVLKKGVFFPARANKLYELYQRHQSLDEIDAKTRSQLEQKYFKRSFEEIYQETRRYFAERRPEEIAKAEQNPKYKMALVFRWYFAYSNRLALTGSAESKVDYQIHTGSALGAFNRWVKDTALEDWHNRHVDDIALKLLHATVELLNRRFQALRGEET